MRGLVFNLLKSAASDAGCESDAWDVITEFAAAEARVQKLSLGPTNGDEARSTHLLLAAEALLSCMTGAPLERVAAGRHSATRLK